MKKKPKKKPVCSSIRKSWDISPVTRVKDSKKKYNRRKIKQLLDH